MTSAAVNDILELSRWAPSGDNTQPWAFEFDDGDDSHAVLHGKDTRHKCVYDLDGHPTQISLGALLETAAIAASEHGLRLDVSRRPDPTLPEDETVFDLHFRADKDVHRSDLVICIDKRTVQRRAMSTRALTVDEKTSLQASVGEGYSLMWIEGFRRALPGRASDVPLCAPAADDARGVRRAPRGHRMECQDQQDPNS